MYRDEAADPPALVCKVGRTELRYHLRCVDDLHRWLLDQGDSVPLGGTDDAQVASMIERTVSRFGRLDAAFNNAGVNSAATETADLSGAEWDRVMAVNLRGVWHCMKHELRQMLRRGGGAIVNNSSIGGLKGSAGRAAY